MSYLIMCGSLAYTGRHLDDIRHQIFDKKQDGLEQTVQQQIVQHDFPCEYIRDNSKGKAVFGCKTNEGQTPEEIAEIFNDNHLHVLSNRYVPISAESVVNANGAPLKTLTSGQAVYVVAEHW
jgi:hypothetical protein